MNQGTGSSGYTGQVKRHQAPIRCPFCNAHRVEISEITGRHMGKGNYKLFSDDLARSDGTIYMFAVHCDSCQRDYRQTYPANLMPLDFQMPTKGVS